MILSDSKIKEYQSKGTLHIENFNEGQLNPNSYNLRLMNKLLVYTEPILDAKANNETREIIIPEEGLLLMPGILYIGSTSEYIEVHEPLLAKVDGRSSIGRLGIFVHYTAGFIDTGFCGNITLEIGCTQPVRIYPNMEICQIEYELVDGKVEKPYCGKYQGQTEPVASRMYRDLEEADDSDPYLESYYHNFPEERPSDDDCEKPAFATRALSNIYRHPNDSNELITGFTRKDIVNFDIIKEPIIIGKLSDTEMMELKDPRTLNTDILGQNEKEVRNKMKKTLTDDIRKVLAKMNINLIASELPERDTLELVLDILISKIQSDKISPSTFNELKKARVKIIMDLVDNKFDDIVRSLSKEELNSYLFSRFYTSLASSFASMDRRYSRYVNFKNMVKRKINDPCFELDVIKSAIKILPSNFKINSAQNEGNE